MVDIQVVSSTLELHRHAVKNLLPTPDRTHYLSNLRDFSRVILGVLLSTPESMEDLKAMKRLWVHEAMRVYYDRLVDDKDKSELFQVVLKTTQAKMKENFSDFFPFICGRMLAKSQSQTCVVSTTATSWSRGTMTSSTDRTRTLEG